MYEKDSACVESFTYYGVAYAGCTDVLAEGKPGDGSYWWCATETDWSGEFVVGSGNYA